MNINIRPTIFLLCMLFVSQPGLAQDNDQTADRPDLTAVTTNDIEIPVDELAIKLVPLTADQLLAEAEAWNKLLQDNVQELARIKLAVKQDNRDLAALTPEEDPDNESNEPSPLTAEQQTVTDRKETHLQQEGVVREQRQALIDRMNAVLDEVTEKIGHADKGLEKEEVIEYRRYISAVGGVDIDVSDSASAASTIRSWMYSKEGGIRWAKNIGSFFFVIAFYWLLAILVSKFVRRMLKMATGTSFIMKRFIVDMIRRVIIFGGFLIGLSKLEISLAPVLAVIGATGFVVAFALQNTLSNFASGLMIMFYRPFDVGDLVDVSGVLGKVSSMTFVSTTIMTPDNKLMVVPNNAIWNNIITNVTGSHIRRVDLVFGIGYSDDIDQAQAVLEKILSDHTLVLNDPEPQVHIHELGDSSVNFVVRPWVNTDDYWGVYWDVTRKVKEQFDAEGISIPFPQRDVHLYAENQNAIELPETEEKT